MNQDQVTSLVRSLLKMAGAALAAHGLTKAAGIVNAEDVIGLILSAVGVFMSHRTHADSPPPPAITKVALLFLLPFLAVQVGCKTPSLETGGAYAQTNLVAGVQPAPDLAFYTVDAAFGLAEQSVQTALKIEYDNRDFLFKLDPQIKHTLDKIRPTSWEVVTAYSAARSSYIVHPTPSGLDTMQTLLSKVQALSIAACTAIQSTTNKTNP